MPRSHRAVSLLGSVTLLAALLRGDPASALTFTVNTTADTNDGSCSVEHCSLREAVTAANAAVGLDKIIVQAGHYVLSRAGVGEDFADKGDLDVRGPLVISGQGADTTIIDADWDDRVLDLIDIGQDYGVIVQRVTLKHGSTLGEPGADGGGIRSGGTEANPIDLTVREAILRRNTSNFAGGGIFFTWGRLSVLRSTLSLNTVDVYNVFPPYRDAYGGGLYVRHGTLVLEDSYLYRNWTWTDGYGATLGGGVYFDSSKSTCTDCTISVSDTTFEWNTSFSGEDRGYGGGLFFKQGVGGPSVTLERNVFFENGASFGGALHLSMEGGQILIENTTITHNAGLMRGGGASFDVRSSEQDIPVVILRHVTLVENTSYNGEAALFAEEHALGLGNSELRFVNTLIEGDCGLAGIGLLTLGGNMESPGDTCGLNGGLDYPSTPAPLHLGTLANYGGLTKTRALLPGSPALDRAFDFACQPTDQRTALRPVVGCDIGAYERLDPEFAFPVFTLRWNPVPYAYVYTRERPPKEIATATLVLAPLAGDVTFPIESDETRTYSIVEEPNLGDAQLLGPTGWHDPSGLMGIGLETQGFLHYQTDATEPGTDQLTIRGTDGQGEPEDLIVTIEIPEPAVALGLAAGILVLTGLAARRRP